MQKAKYLVLILMLLAMASWGNSDGPKTCYLYSYKGVYPIAEIKNADYVAVASVLGSPTIIAFSNLINPSKATIDAFLAPLTALPNAFITSYSYKPLIGITSITDPKGLTTFYEYDNFGRLENIKDRNGDIVKNYKYNYADGSTLPGATITYFNAKKSVTLTKSCPSGQTSSQVTYTVEVGKYTSTLNTATADAMADAEIATYAQAYANKMGSCVISSVPGTPHPNEAFTITRTKNNCPSGQTGSAVAYVVPANTYTSLVSQADARIQAEALVGATAQENANNLGSCTIPPVTYPNPAFVIDRTKNNCPAGQTGTAVNYTVPANTYSSLISESDAKMHAEVLVNDLAQANANSLGICNLPVPNTFSLAFSSPTNTMFKVRFINAATNIPQDFTMSGNNTISNIPTGTGSIEITDLLGSNLSFSYNLNGEVKTGLSALFPSVSFLGLTALTITPAQGTIYYNAAMTVYRFKNNCASGYVSGPSVPYSIASGLVSSTISQAEADRIARLDPAIQANANSYGTCVLASSQLGYILPYGSQFSVEITNTTYNLFINQTLQGSSSINVPNGISTVKLTSVIPNKKYRFTFAGQVKDGSSVEFYGVNFTYGANIYVSELFSNEAITVFKTRNNCSFGLVSAPIGYTISAGTYTSTVSQAAVDQLVQDDIAANAQAFANAQATCVTPSYSISYSVPANKSFNVTISGTSYGTISGTGILTFTPPMAPIITLQITPVTSEQYSFTVAGQTSTGYSLFTTASLGVTPIPLTITVQ